MIRDFLFGADLPLREAAPLLGAVPLLCMAIGAAWLGKHVFVAIADAFERRPEGRRAPGGAP